MHNEFVQLFEILVSIAYLLFSKRYLIIFGMCILVTAEN